MVGARRSARITIGKTDSATARGMVSLIDKVSATMPPIIVKITGGTGETERATAIRVGMSTGGEMITGARRGGHKIRVLVTLKKKIYVSSS